MTSASNTSTGVTICGEQLWEESSFKYLEANLSKDGTCSAEILTRIITATEEMARVEMIWKSNISIHIKFKLDISLVVSTLIY